MQKYLTWLCIIALLSLGGCASTDDLRRVHGALDRQIQLTNEKITGVEQGVAASSVALKGELAVLRSETDKSIEKTNGVISALRGGQADGRADVTEVRDQLQQIRGSIDGLKRDIAAAAAAAAKADRRSEEDKALREKLDSLTFRINFIETFLGIGKKGETADATEKSAKPPAPASKEAPLKVKMDKESLYAAAYDFFREGKYDKSREAFESFLKQFPHAENSDNAQFWIGECYYFEKKYEKAIVEYDKIVKNFPESGKVPYALLKQGLSFLNLGDKTSAKLLLQQVIKDFPNTSQARIARNRLAEIK